MYERQDKSPKVREWMDGDKLEKVVFGEAGMVGGYLLLLTMCHTVVFVYVTLWISVCLCGYIPSLCTHSCVLCV